MGKRPGALSRSVPDQLARVGSLRSVVEVDMTTEEKKTELVVAGEGPVPLNESPNSRRLRKAKKSGSLRSLFQSNDDGEEPAVEKEADRPNVRQVGSLRSTFEMAKERAALTPRPKRSLTLKKEDFAGKESLAIKPLSSTDSLSPPRVREEDQDQQAQEENDASPKNVNKTNDKQTTELRENVTENVKRDINDTLTNSEHCKVPDLSPKPGNRNLRNEKSKEKDSKRALLMRVDSINLSRSVSRKGSPPIRAKKPDARSLLMRADSINLSRPKNRSVGRFAAEPPGDAAAQDGDSNETDSSKRSLFVREDSLNLSRSLAIKAQDETSDLSPAGRKDGFLMLSGGPVRRRDSLEMGDSNRKRRISRRDSLDASCAKLSPRPPSLHEDTTNARSSPTGRRVLFNLSKNVSLDPYEEPPAPGSYFYAREDYRKFKDHTNSRVQKMAESTVELDSVRRQVISGIYLTCCQVREEIQNVPSDFLPPAAESALKACYDSSGGHVGLELVSVSELREDNGKRRRQILQIVLGIQKELHFLPRDTVAEVLRQGLEPVTRPSALFARAVARVLAAVVAESHAEVAEDEVQKLHQRTLESETKKRQPKRKVQFAKSKPKVFGCAANADLADESWYTRKENQAFRDSVTDEVESLKESETAEDTRYKGIVSGLYLTCCNVEQEDAEISFLPKKAKESLKSCMSESEHRLGLEMMALQCLRDDNIHRRRDHLNRVLEMQKSLKNHPYPSHVRAEVIQRAVERISLPSRLFALEMAIAQAPENCPSVKSDTEKRLIRSDSKRQLMRSGSKRMLLKSNSQRKLSRADSKKLLREDSKKKLSKDEPKKKPSKDEPKKKSSSKEDSRKKLLTEDTEEKPPKEDSKPKDAKKKVAKVDPETADHDKVSKKKPSSSKKPKGSSETQQESSETAEPVDMTSPQHARDGIPVEA